MVGPMPLPSPNLIISPLINTQNKCKKTVKFKYGVRSHKVTCIKWQKSFCDLVHRLSISDPTNTWQTAAIFGKKPCKIAISLQLDPYSGPTIKILNFWKSKMAAAAILKITKITISLQRFDRSLQNLVSWCQMGPLTTLTVNEFEFGKSKKADGRHFENR